MTSCISAGEKACWRRIKPKVLKWAICGAVSMVASVGDLFGICKDIYWESERPGFMVSQNTVDIISLKNR